MAQGPATSALSAYTVSPPPNAGSRSVQNRKVSNCPCQLQYPVIRPRLKFTCFIAARINCFPLSSSSQYSRTSAGPMSALAYIFDELPFASTRNLFRCTALSQLAHELSPRARQDGR